MVDMPNESQKTLPENEVTFDGNHYRLPPGVSSKIPLMSELIEWNTWLGAGTEGATP